mmetsp:Transcript_19839/g.43397  ORF Transcript_19839/g.43397 Transcript_19839/m.43397 type:complete len:293 (+) Transcript_19839:91-969(+)
MPTSTKAKWAAVFRLRRCPYTPVVLVCSRLVEAALVSLACSMRLGAGAGGELLSLRSAPEVRALALPEVLALGVDGGPCEHGLLLVVGVADSGHVGGEGGEHVAHKQIRPRQQEHVHRRLEDLHPRAALDEVGAVAVVLVLLVAAVVRNRAVLLKVLVRIRPLAVGGEEDGGDVADPLRLQDLLRELPLVVAHVGDGPARIRHVVHLRAALALALEPAEVHGHVAPLRPSELLLAERLHLRLDGFGGLDVLPEECGGLGLGAHGHGAAPRAAAQAQHRVVPRLLAGHVGGAR